MGHTLRREPEARSTDVAACPGSSSPVAWCSRNARQQPSYTLPVTSPATITLVSALSCAGLKGSSPHVRLSRYTGFPQMISIPKQLGFGMQ
jgi:hypothetical protein